MTWKLTTVSTASSGSGSSREVAVQHVDAGVAGADVLDRGQVVVEPDDLRATSAIMLAP